MKVLTYILYKEHFKLYAETHYLIALNSLQIELVRKTILISDTAVIIYRAGSRTCVEYIKFTFSAGLILLMILMEK